MKKHTPYISTKRPRIRQLNNDAINRIAAGEVVERPASAVKELIENALDANAQRLRIDIADGGKTLIRVIDDGFGISAQDLPLAMSRHATSKIDGSDLLNINSFGFRGEALPSLGAVGRLSITSRTNGFDAAQITVAGGKQDAVKPASMVEGTIVELRDLFYATPARLKFMRTNRAETQAISDTVKRLAMASPFVGFQLNDISSGKQRKIFSVSPKSGDLFDVLQVRLTQILGKDFSDNALRIRAKRDGFTLSGYAALPTFSRGAGVMQHFFVNGRPVRDKLLIGALRAAYSDLLSRDRHPAAALFVECQSQLVDVNVHPAKSEVRFRQPGLLRGLIISSLRHALAEAGYRASTTLANAVLGATISEQKVCNFSYQLRQSNSAARATNYQMQTPQFAETTAVHARVEVAEKIDETKSLEDVIEAYPLGAARGQVHENYIIAQTTDGIVIVDQHAAHERLIYEELKQQTCKNGVPSQTLLIPEIIDLSADDCLRLLEFSNTLERVGLIVEGFGGGAVAVRATPAILGQVDAKLIVMDVLDEICDQNSTKSVNDKVEAILSRVACHGSIRSGRRMRGEEMNALLREMERTPFSGQCNHGRPTYVELKLSDIERLFGRK